MRNIGKLNIMFHCPVPDVPVLRLMAVCNNRLQTASYGYNTIKNSSMRKVVAIVKKTGFLSDTLIRFGLYH